MCKVKIRPHSIRPYYIYDGEWSERGRRDIDGQVREGSGRDERERMSQKPILEYRATAPSNPAKNVYGKGIDEILMRYDPTLNQNQTFYYQQDHEGSVTHLLNTSGNVIEKYKYDAFGLPAIFAPDGITLRNASIVSNRFLFTGREYANLFGFYEYRARAYHPTLGRFMSEDPKGFVRLAQAVKSPTDGIDKSPDDWSFAAHPDEGELNLFRYCGNDPVDFTDPMGLNFDGTKDAQEVESIPGRFGQSAAQLNVVTVGEKDGSFTNRLDVTVIQRQVARKVFWHGRMVTRRDEQKRVTAEEHEKREHNKDFQRFHDEHQKDVSGARFQTRDAATAAAKAAEKSLMRELRKANSEFNQHKDRQRWEPIEKRERPW